MKFFLKRNFFMHILTILTLYLFLSQLVTTKDVAPKINLYKYDKNIKHSLFKERDSVDRLSISHQGIPLIIK